MSGDGGWREGARTGCPDDVCPGCAHSPCLFASDFKVAFSKKSVRVCTSCQSVYVNWKREGDLAIYPTAGA